MSTRTGTQTRVRLSVYLHAMDKNNNKHSHTQQPCLHSIAFILSACRSKLVLVEINKTSPLHTHTHRGQLCGQALTPSKVSDEPLIQTSRDVQVPGTNRTEPSPELRGDVAVHGFWVQGTTAIFDIPVTNMDTPSNRNTAHARVLEKQEKEKSQVWRNTAPARVLEKQEKEKKVKYGALCIARR
jgi:hypothetical protein